MLIMLSSLRDLLLLKDSYCWIPWDMAAGNYIDWICLYCKSSCIQMEFPNLTTLSRKLREPLNGDNSYTQMEH
uniref:Uncharacterized protein n=1 Tax=Rhizophora mucronata TaxID=61149 RepID=A0A2P2PRJ0_RHIMU